MNAYVTEGSARATLEYRVRDADSPVRPIARKSLRAVLTWGISDANTWLNGRHPRPDGLRKRPLPFDAEMKPKPAFYAMLEAINSAPARS